MFIFRLLKEIQTSTTTRINRHARHNILLNSYILIPEIDTDIMWDRDSLQSSISKMLKMKRDKRESIEHEAKKMTLNPCILASQLDTYLCTL